MSFDPDSKKIYFAGGVIRLPDHPFRECTICKHVKIIDCFPFRDNRRQNRRNQCQECLNRRARENLDKRRPEVREYHRNYRKQYNGTPKQRANALYQNARRRALETGIEFSLTKRFIEIALEKGFCEQTGIKFDMQSDAETNSGRRWFTPSIDKIDPKKGYTDANTQIVVWCYNAGKGEMSDEEFLQFAIQFVEYQKCMNRQ